MRPALLVLTALTLAACSADTADPAPEVLKVAGSLRYQATTLAGAPLLNGRLVVNVLGDSSIGGSWRIEWAPGADTTVRVGDQVGSGTLRGRLTEEGAYLDLNPGYADNNVILLVEADERGFQGTWYWASIAGPQTEGRFSAVRD